MPANYEQMELVSVATNVRITAREKRIADELVSRNPAFMYMEEVVEDSAEPTTASDIRCDEFVIVISREEQLIAERIIGKQGLSVSRRLAERRQMNTSAEKRKSNDSILLVKESELALESKTRKKSKDRERKSRKEKRKESVNSNDNSPSNTAERPPPVKLTLRLGRKKLPMGAEDADNSTTNSMEEWVVEQSAADESRRPPSKRSRSTAGKSPTPERESDSNLLSSTSMPTSPQEKICAPTMTTRAKETHRPHLPPQQNLTVIPWAYPLNAFVVLKKDIRTNPDRPRYIYRVCEDKLKRYNRIAEGYQIDFLDVEGYENIMLEDKVQSNPDLFESIDVMDSEAITVHLKKEVTSSNTASPDLVTSFEVHFEESLTAEGDV